ncbi:Kazal peptide Pr13a-like [Leguminivora glycinivorella]|uniref:Kazal peptide Pr13a-like n=1 Tax=Leguminivora glycinivorella TaxID=1035111 RepID=UPI00200D03F4|nr:Kazal peptide Pr13a-like [Leguminivora glycinivorella]
MKAVTFAIFAVLFVAVSCRPDKPDLTKLKAEAARKKACTHDCTSVALDPVCAGKQGDKPKSFANECVMNNYNCEHKDTLHKISKGECPGSQGIRLS